MAGKTISQLTDAGNNLLATDYIPLARGATTLRTSGAALSANFLPKAGGTLSSNSNTVATLTITQAGTSYALKVNDQSGSDTSPFAIDSFGHVLVSTPKAKNGKDLISTVPDATGFGLSSPFVATLSALSGDSGLYIKSKHGIPLYIEDGTDNDATPFVVDNGGKVGIGTKTPNTSLTIVGDVSATGKGTFEANVSQSLLTLTQRGAGNALNVSGGTGNALNVSGITKLVCNDNANPALTITQAGTSYALKVNDQSGSDTSPFAIDSFGHVLVSTPKAKNGKDLISTVPDATGFGLSSPFVATLSALSGDSGLYIKSKHGIPLYIEDGTDNDATPFVVDNGGKVGIGTKTPNTSLTIVGDVSATGSFISKNNFYLPTNGTDISTGARVGFFGTVVSLAPLSKYELEYNLYLKNDAGYPKVVYSLSASKAFTTVNANFMQDLGGLSAVSTGTVVGKSGTTAPYIVDIGLTEAFTPSCSAFGLVKAIVTTGVAATTIALTLSSNSGSTITPLAGSYRKVTLFS